jgi:3-hydroxypropanoate dehydrogenase
VSADGAIRTVEAGVRSPAGLDSTVLDQIFRAARTRNGWSSRPVEKALLHELYDLLKWGPTAANASPARFVFLTTGAAKARLAPLLSAANRDKTLAAPATVIIGYDLAFAKHLSRLFPHAPGAKNWFADPEHAQSTAFRNGSLQGAYLIIAARALGLDCGPMSGFDAAGVDAEFFAGTTVRSNFICSLGYGTDENLFDRNPRLSFEEACTIL